MAGLLTILIVLHFYPLLHDALPILSGFCVFLLPGLIFPFVKRRHKSRTVDWARRACLWSGCANMFIAALLALNGMADHSPVRRIQTTVVSKFSTSGKYRPSYYIVVVSWHLGQSTEDLPVDRQVYSATHTGETVLIELHPGFFGFPWGSRVLPG
jgi:hypothetical protein